MNIRDIAKISGVSASTVSKIINNKDQNISDTTRTKVLKVIKEYNFVPYAKIAGRSPAITGILGVLLTASNENSADFLAGFEESAVANGYNVLLCNAGSRQSIKSLDLLSSKEIDGLAILCDDSDYDFLHNRLELFKFPMLFAGHLTKRDTITAYTLNYNQIGLTATQHLIDLGHDLIGYITCERESDSSDSIEAGYIKALYTNELNFNPEYICCGASPEDAVRKALRQIEILGSTAFVCSSGEIAMILSQHLNRVSIRVPEDISIVCARDSSLFASFSPSMTAVSVPYFQLGKLSADGLMDIAESKKNVFKHRELESALIPRESTAPPTTKKFKGEKIIVVGSMNMDVIVRVPQMPTNGQTIIAYNTSFIPGGKGANQAVGAGKLGGNVYAIGKLGDDPEGREVFKSLVNSSVNIRGIQFTSRSPTGKAYINVSPEGESSIVVYPGANNEFDTGQLDKFDEFFVNSKYCLLSMEISSKAVEHTILICERNRVEVILKPSSHIDKHLLSKIAYLIPNEIELEQLVKGDMPIDEKADFLYRSGVENVIITLGSRGCYLKNSEHARYFPAADFKPVDTTGAADAFISALAVSLSEGHRLIEAIMFATYAAGISITREGVQPALPDRMTLDYYKDKYTNI